MNKNKILAFVGLFVVLLVFSGCGKEVKEIAAVESSSNRSSNVMKAVDGEVTLKPSEEIKNEKKTTDSKLVEKKQTSTSEKDMKLVKAYGEAYASFSSLNVRNDRLRDLMTKECADLNGINYKTGNGLSSEGEVTSIYQNDKEEYAVLLDCIQNGSPVRVLLLAKVENGLVSEMTYNHLKQEY